MAVATVRLVPASTRGRGAEGLPRSKWEERSLSGSVPVAQCWQSAETVRDPVPALQRLTPVFRWVLGLFWLTSFEEQGPEPHSQVIYLRDSLTQVTEKPKSLHSSKDFRLVPRGRAHTSKGVEQKKKTQKNPTPNFVSSLGSPWAAGLEVG